MSIDLHVEIFLNLFLFYFHLRIGKGLHVHLF